MIFNLCYYIKMNNQFKRNKIESIYNLLNKTNMIKEKVDIDQVQKDLEYLNFLLYKTYKIFNSDKTRKDKIDELHNLKTPEGKRLFTKKIAKKIYERYNIVFKNLINKLKHNRINRIKSIQKGGDLNINDNKIEKILNVIRNDPKYKAQVIKVIQGYVDSPLAAEIKNALSKINISSGKTQYDEGNGIFDWIFFPLYKLENLPLVGFMFEVPLDFISILLDNSDIIMESVAPVIPVALDLATDIGSGIPIPGVNTAIAAASVGLTVIEEPMEWFLADGIDVVGLFINISRKQWGLAYLSALEVIPILPSIVDAAVTNMSILNKHLAKGVKLTELVKDNTLLASSMLDLVQKDKYGLFDPVKVWNRVIYPNRDRAKFLKKLPIEDINRLIPMFETIKDEISNTNKLMEEVLNSKDSLQTFKIK